MVDTRNLAGNRASLGRVLAISNDNTQVFAAAFLDDSMKRMADQMGSQIGEAIQVFSESLRNKFRRNRDGRITKIHQSAAELAQKSVLKSYDSITRVSPRHISRPKRSRKGALRGAIAAKSFYEARWDGVGFINAVSLDRQAKHWYRLNFGAGDRGESSPRPSQYRMEFFGQELGSISLAFNRPSDSFSIPTGVWIGSDKRPTNALSGATFLTYSMADEKGLLVNEFLRFEQETRGIAAQNFFESGMATLATQIPAGWNLLIREFFKEASRFDTGPVSSQISKTAARRYSVALNKASTDIKIIAAQAGPSRALRGLRS